MEVFILFKVNEANNSTDLDYELDYMFRGVYKTYEKAYEQFLNSTIELYEMYYRDTLEVVEEDNDEKKERKKNSIIYEEKLKKFEEISINIKNYNDEELEDILYREEWKIITAELEL